jgi:chromosome partitioning protein
MRMAQHASREPVEAMNGVALPGRVVAIANQKGGVGKTTTAVNLAAGLGALGRRVLVVDLDPQGNASTGLGVGSGQRSRSIYDVITGRASSAEALMDTGIERVQLVPSTVDLAGAEIELVGQFARESLLKHALAPLRDRADVILLDCPPSLGLLTVNALTAAGEVLVPIQCEYFALEGLAQLLRNLRLIQQNVNPSLRLNGIVLTMYDGRTRLSEQVMAEVRSYFGAHVYDSVIPRSVRVSEAPGYGMPVLLYDPGSRAAQAYRTLSREFADRQVAGGGAALPGDLELLERPTAGPAATGERDQPVEAHAEPGIVRLADDVDGEPSEGEQGEPTGDQSGDAPFAVAVAAEAPATQQRKSRWPFKRPKGGDA